MNNLSKYIDLDDFDNINVIAITNNRKYGNNPAVLYLDLEPFNKEITPQYENKLLKLIEKNYKKILSKFKGKKLIVVNDSINIPKGKIKDLEEITTTASGGAYLSKYAFGPAKREVQTQAGYKPVNQKELRKNVKSYDIMTYKGVNESINKDLKEQIDTYFDNWKNGLLSNNDIIELEALTEGNDIAKRYVNERMGLTEEKEYINATTKFKKLLLKEGGYKITIVVTDLWKKLNHGPIYPEDLVPTYWLKKLHKVLNDYIPELKKVLDEDEIDRYKDIIDQFKKSDITIRQFDNIWTGLLSWADENTIWIRTIY